MKKTTGKSKTSTTAKAATNDKAAKAPPMRAKGPQKATGGRPTKYLPIYADLAHKAALLGATDAEMAGHLGVAESTFHLWKREHPGFSESINAGKERADAAVAASLYRTALGGGTVTEIREEPDSEGNIIMKRVVRELPADVRAQRYWLGNRHPKLWRDRVVLIDETPPEVVAETANRFVEIMARSRARQQAVLAERGLLPDGEA
ncbi:hypothetical protein [Luteimonas sp. MC1828]|uniref:hypothetical protein n=1 Tax=Luteimonas sp. MC1828 TaxID=2799787 RepID=UPI0018F1776B|nr:hypothetical protein [Luteimonas sp. MC1828]MBJ7575672.1 hypothetical protein [Luteimonas sp. MC1828]